MANPIVLARSTQRVVDRVPESPTVNYFQFNQQVRARNLKRVAEVSKVRKQVVDADTSESTPFRSEVGGKRAKNEAVQTRRPSSTMTTWEIGGIAARGDCAGCDASNDSCPAVTCAQRRPHPSVVTPSTRILTDFGCQACFLKTSRFECSIRNQAISSHIRFPMPAVRPDSLSQANLRRRSASLFSQLKVGLDRRWNIFPGDHGMWLPVRFLSASISRCTQASLSSIAFCSNSGAANLSRRSSSSGIRASLRLGGPASFTSPATPSYFHIYHPKGHGEEFAHLPEASGMNNQVDHRKNGKRAENSARTPNDLLEVSMRLARRSIRAIPNAEPPRMRLGRAPASQTSPAGPSISTTRWSAARNARTYWRFVNGQVRASCTIPTRARSVRLVPLCDWPLRSFGLRRSFCESISTIWVSVALHSVLYRHGNRWTMNVGFNVAVNAAVLLHLRSSIGTSLERGAFRTVDHVGWTILRHTDDELPDPHLSSCNVTDAETMLTHADRVHAARPGAHPAQPCPKAVPAAKAKLTAHWAVETPERAMREGGSGIRRAGGAGAIAGGRPKVGEADKGPVRSQRARAAAPRARGSRGDSGWRRRVLQTEERAPAHKTL
ncbi:hypothetical protein DFH06DRAFT_1131922 [Mycena polygramma]|nr:hypothetical protein DFH06DRAFT_1131922 [Mycena polygramma]